MAAPAQVQVTGLKEVRKAFKQMGDATGFRDAIKPVFAKISDRIASEASASAAGSRMGHVAAGSIRGKATTTNASISAYKGVAWGPGHEFGSIRYRQFPPKQVGGYHIYPTIAKERDWIGDTMVEEAANAFDRYAS